MVLMQLRWTLTISKLDDITDPKRERQCYMNFLQLFEWMQIEADSLNIVILNN